MTSANASAVGWFSRVQLTEPSRLLGPTEDRKAKYNGRKCGQACWQFHFTVSCRINGEEYQLHILLLFNVYVMINSSQQMQYLIRTYVYTYSFLLTDHVITKWD